MIVGIPKEIKDHEYRVSLLPSATYQLLKRGHQVIVERGAGAGAGYPDADYEQAGATMVADHRLLFDKADMIVKVKEPQPSEYPLLRPGQILSRICIWPRAAGLRKRCSSPASRRWLMKRLK